MGKRSEFTRRKNDLYETFDPRALAALSPHLTDGTRFVEPCAGRGDMIDGLVALGHECIWACDIAPKRNDIIACDVLETKITDDFDCFITNPPWTRSIMHPIIVHLSNQRPTWLLFDADWMHTKQSAPYMNRLRKVVSVGRLRWIPDTKMDGKDNCAWYLFDVPSDEPTVFIGRI